MPGRNYFFGVLGHWGLIDLQILQAIATALGYLPEFDGKTLFLKLLQTQIIEHGNIKPVWTYKLHPYWLAFMVVEGTMQTTGRER